MENLIEDIKQDMIDKLESGYDCYIEDLHHELCNTEYFIIGTYKAKKWLGDNVFDVIEKIKEYEKFNFGEVYTDFSEPEKVCNMLAYIVGEELLTECKAFKPWHCSNVQMDKHRTEALIKQLKSINSLELVA
jgi:glycerol-3-phosphate O-acyltransferase